MKNINKIISLSVLILLGVVTVLFANANKFTATSYLNIQNQAQAQTNIIMNVNPGMLSQYFELDISTPPKIILAPVDISLIPPTGTDSTSDLRIIVKDHRGPAVGWNQTISCSDFTNEGNNTNTIPVTNLTITPETITGLGGSDSTGIVPGTSHTFLSNIDTMTLATAPPGTGNGRYVVSSHLSLHVEKNTPPGIYLTTMTITIN